MTDTHTYRRAEPGITGYPSLSAYCDVKVDGKTYHQFGCFRCGALLYFEAGREGSSIYCRQGPKGCGLHFYPRFEP